MHGIIVEISYYVIFSIDISGYFQPYKRYYYNNILIFLIIKYIYEDTNFNSSIFQNMIH